MGETIGRRWAIIIPPVLGIPTAFLYALQGLFACSGVHVQYPACLSERIPRLSCAIGSCLNFESQNTSFSVGRPRCFEAKPAISAERGTS